MMRSLRLLLLSLLARRRPSAMPPPPFGALRPLHQPSARANPWLVVVPSLLPRLLAFWQRSDDEEEDFVRSGRRRRVYQLSSKKEEKKEQEERSRPQSHFNFIERAVAQCLDSICYIELLDDQTDNATATILSNASGFVIKESGWILTNAHVVISVPSAIINVKLADGSQHRATLEDLDLQKDLALLKISREGLPALRLGNSHELKVGEWVVALGSPLSLSQTAMVGVVSFKDRRAEELGFDKSRGNYIQTDAAITFGNSGGPLINLAGEVVGINNLKITTGISFAIPIDDVKTFLGRCEYYNKGGKPRNLRYNSIGITTFNINETMVRKMERTAKMALPFDLKHGVFVWKVVDGTTAQQCGLKEGDIITHANEWPIRSASDMYAVFRRVKTNLVLSVYRGETRKKIQVVVPSSTTV